MSKRIVKGGKNYPKLLMDLPDPPEQFYYRGNIKLLQESNFLAVIGSRRMTSYGKQVVDLLIPPLVSLGYKIISGFMYGVDTLAHQTCIDNGGKTIAVFASGLDICYPPENQKLYDRIIETGGLLISEYEDGKKPKLWTFPKRNRIVAALSDKGTLVIEAAEKSGSLVTAMWTTKLKRPLYAVPGSITSLASKGANELIQSLNAKMVVKSNDIDGNVHINKGEQVDLDLGKKQAKIIQRLKEEPLTLDELSLSINEPITEVSIEVSLLGLKGLISEENGILFAKK